MVVLQGTFCPLERVQEDLFTGEYQREAIMPRRLWAKLLAAAGVCANTRDRGLPYKEGVSPFRYGSGPVSPVQELTQITSGAA